MSQTETGRRWTMNGRTLAVIEVLACTPSGLTVAGIVGETDISDSNIRYILAEDPDWFVAGDRVPQRGRGPNPRRYRLSEAGKERVGEIAAAWDRIARYCGVIDRAGDRA